MGRGGGLLYLSEDIDDENEKKNCRGKEDESCARLILDRDTSVLANEITHVGSKNVNKTGGIGHRSVSDGYSTAVTTKLSTTHSPSRPTHSS